MYEYKTNKRNSTSEVWAILGTNEVNIVNTSEDSSFTCHEQSECSHLKESKGFPMQVPGVCIVSEKYRRCNALKNC